MSAWRPRIPAFSTDKAAEEFVATADLSEYDLSGGQFVRFEFQPKSERVNMRLPAPLLKAVKDRAKRQGIPYQRFIRQALEQALESRKA